MKTLITTFLSFALLISLQAQKRNVDVGDFSELSLGIPATLYIKQGSNEKEKLTVTTTYLTKSNLRCEEIDWSSSEKEKAGTGTMAGDDPKWMSM